MAARRRRIRHSSPTRHVCDTGIGDREMALPRMACRVNDGRLVALAPAVEEATGIRDRLLEELAASGLDADRALDRALNEAAEAFRSQPPDFNESTTNVRIALETAAPCWEARAPVPPAMRCGSLGRPMRKPFYGLGWTPARAGLCRRSCNMRATRNAVHARPLKLPPRQIFDTLESTVLLAVFSAHSRQTHCGLDSDDMEAVSGENPQPSTPRAISRT
jgi:hypothetical protein